MERKQLRPFADWLREQRNGALHQELSEALADLVLACAEHQKVGTLTLKLKVSPDAAVMFVTDEVTANEPKAERPRALYFGDDEGNLTRRDPRQMTFDQPLRKVDDDTPAEPTPEEGQAQ